VAVRVCFGTLIAFTAYMVLSSTGPALASSYNFVAPVIGTVLGVSLGSETVTRDEMARGSRRRRGRDGGRRRAWQAPARE